MSESRTIQNVLLREGDLNATWSPWRRINRANNLRLLPIVAGVLGSAFAVSAMLDPSFGELVALVGPLFLGWYAFIWLTNVTYMGEYKKAYAATPIGADPCTFVFDANGMRQTLPRGESTFFWSAFVDVVENKDGFRFWMTPYMAVCLPARYLTEHTAIQLRALVQDARERGEIKGV